ncbi:hypothetical protein GWO43_16030 [candidate division KSB1 bacterium]|nr:hypothetical protein [candidate division KSB1 bacterium]NIT72352.1 hypothetical protein [candidate division KSB1 bacterium]NIX72032.1 hypothetical protein [candidate division KSB1 bacterium]
MRERRQELEARKRRSEALGLLGETLFPDVPSTVTPGGTERATANLDLGDSANRILNTQTSPGVDRSRERNLFGLLGTVAPEAVAGVAVNSLFPQQQQGRLNLPEKIAVIERKLGRKLTEDEVLAAANIDKAGGIDELLKRLDADEKIRAREKETRELREKNLAAEEKTRETSDAIVSGIQNLNDVFQANRDLQGTVGEPGREFQDVRDFGIRLASEFPTIGNFFGIDDAQDIQIARDNLKKGAANVLIDTFETLNSLGQLTDQKLRSIKQALAGFGTNPFTNAKILASQGRELLAIIRRKRLPIDTGGLEKMIREADLMVEAQKRGIL